MQDLEKKNNKCAFIICWFGKLPPFLDIWIKTAKYNDRFDFLFFTDQDYEQTTPNNIIFLKMTLNEFRETAKNTLDIPVYISKAYKICDFRPAYGVIFNEIIKKYNFWGYCDIDLIFGKISDFVSDEDLVNYDAIFNAGHFTLLRNNYIMNHLFEKAGAAFDYRTVFMHDAVFAFDEYTGIQLIAKTNKIKAKFGIDFVDADRAHYQLISRSDSNNPKYQAFYWENGELYRVCIIDNKIMYKQICYIHLQKRKMDLLIDIEDNSFWITPNSLCKKEYLGEPNFDDIKSKNPYQGIKVIKKENRNYKSKKIIEILGRNPYQIYVRIKQEKYGINQHDNSINIHDWKIYID